MDPQRLARNFPRLRSLHRRSHRAGRLLFRRRCRCRRHRRPRRLRLRPLVVRGRLLYKLAEKIRANSAALAELEARNSGKPIVEAEFDIADVATCFEYYAGLANTVLGHVNPVPANALSFTLREPVGVAGQIIPWNYPLLMAAWKLAPALAAGCTCVLKPAEQTPLTALEMANWFEETGFPPGVVNIVNGFGETAGAALVAHPQVDKIAFTGSAAVGKLIVKSAADTLKRVTLELG